MVVLPAPNDKLVRPWRALCSSYRGGAKKDRVQRWAFNRDALGQSLGERIFLILFIFGILILFWVWGFLPVATGFGLCFFIHFWPCGLSHGPDCEANELWVKNVWDHVSEAVCPHLPDLYCHAYFFQRCFWVVLLFDFPKRCTTSMQYSTLSRLKAGENMFAGLERPGGTFRSALNG